jgi:addiction module HigA family antidote
MSVPPNRITGIIKGQRGITGYSALRLSEFFGNSAKFWMNLQASYDLRKAEDVLPKRALRYIQEHRAAFVPI